MPRICQQQRQKIKIRPENGQILTTQLQSGHTGDNVLLRQLSSVPPAWLWSQMNVEKWKGIIENLFIEHKNRWNSIEIILISFHLVAIVVVVVLRDVRVVRIGRGLGLDPLHGLEIGFDQHLPLVQLPDIWKEVLNQSMKKILQG